MNEKRRKIPTLALIVTVIAAAVGSSVARIPFTKFVRSGTQNEPFEQLLVKTAKELNKNLPMIVDKTMRLDTTAAYPGNKFLFVYTLVGVSREEFDAATFKQDTRAKLVNHYKTAEDMKLFRDRGVELVYRFRGEDATVFGEVTVSPRDFE